MIVFNYLKRTNNMLCSHMRHNLTKNINYRPMIELKPPSFVVFAVKYEDDKILCRDITLPVSRSFSHPDFWPQTCKFT